MTDRELTAAKSLIREKKLIAILRGVPADKIVPTLEALHEGGVSVAEATLDHRGKAEYLASLAALVRAASALGARMLIGVGTALSAGDVEDAVSAGAAFVVSPHVNSTVIEQAKILGAVSIPGAYTPTEIVAAYAGGADFVKVYPAEPAYFRAVRAPLGHIPMIAVGGVDAGNAAGYFAAGAAAVGVGGSLVRMDRIAAGDWAAVRAAAEAMVQAVSRVER